MLNAMCIETGNFWHASTPDQWMLKPNPFGNARMRRRRSHAYFPKLMPEFLTCLSLFFLRLRVLYLSWPIFFKNNNLRCFLARKKEN